MVLSRAAQLAAIELESVAIDPLAIGAEVDGHCAGADHVRVGCTNAIPLRIGHFRPPTELVHATRSARGSAPKSYG
jgi:hypothetical protein